MHRTLRAIHLCSGVFSALFLIMYAVSAMQMAHFRWFRLQPKVVETALAVDSGQAVEPRALARHLMDRHGLRGEVRQVETKDGKISFNIVRPGTVHQVGYV